MNIFLINFLILDKKLEIVEQLIHQKRRENLSRIFFIDQSLNLKKNK